MPASSVPLICYHLPTVSAFFRSVALAISIQKHTSLSWETYKDSAFLNAAYTVLFWKEPPGTAEVRSANRAVMEAEAEKLHGQFLLTWLNKVHTEGPMSGNLYVQRMAEVREYAREAVQDLYREAGQINAAVAGETQQAISTLAKIRLASAVGVAVIGGAAGVAFAASAAAAAAGGAAAGATAAGGITVFGLQAGASATTFGLVGLGYSTTNSLIKVWEEGNNAKAVAIDPGEDTWGDTTGEKATTAVGKEIGKAGLSELGGSLSGKALEQALAQQARSSNIISSANGVIRQQSERLAAQTLKKKAAAKAANVLQGARSQVARESTNLANAASKAKVAGGMMRGIPVIFAAWDIVEAWGDYQETMQRNR